MAFLHPTLFLAGAACIAIPILIHLLLRQRRKPIPWAAMRFLLEAWRKHRRRLRLQQWLLLAVRCLLVALLAAAIGRPLLQRAGLLGGSSGRAIYLLIDNGVGAQYMGEVAGGAATDSSSPSAPASSAPRAALDRHKAAARAIIDALGPGDRAGLIALGAPAEATVVPASSDLASVRELVDALEPTDAATDLAGALDRLGAAVSRGEAGGSGGGAARLVVVVLSDFLKGAADLSRPLPPALRDLPPDVSLAVLALPPAAPAGGAANVQIVNVEPLRAVVLTGSGGQSQGEQVQVSLRRSGAGVADAATTTVRLRVVTPGAPESPAAAARAGAQGLVRWQPGQNAATISLQVDASANPERERADALAPPGASPSPLGAAPAPPAAGGVLVAEIERDALPADDSFRRPIGVRESLRIGLVAQRRFGTERADRLSPADWVSLALLPTPDAPFDLVEVEPSAVDQPTLANLDVLFVPSPDLLPEDAWPRLARFAEQGGMLVITPPADATVHLWTDAMTRALSLPWRIAREPKTETVALSDQRPDSALWTRLAAEMETLAKPVTILKTLPVEESPPETEVLLRLSNGAPWMLASATRAATKPGTASASSTQPGGTGAPPATIRPSTSVPQGAAKPDTASPDAASPTRGLIVYIASALNLGWTDLPAKPLMVPLMQELVRQGFGRAAGNWSSIAGRRAAGPGRAAALRPIDAATADDAGAPVEVDDAGVSRRPLRRAGLWRATDAAGRTRGYVAVNADADAARIEPLDASAVQSWLSAGLGADDAAGKAGGEPSRRVTFDWLDRIAPAASISRDTGGSPLSFPLLLAALALGAIEALLARWFSHAAAAPSKHAAGLDVSLPGSPAAAA